MHGMHAAAAATTTTTTAAVVAAAHFFPCVGMYTRLLRVRGRIRIPCLAVAIHTQRPITSLSLNMSMGTGTPTSPEEGKLLSS